MSPNVQQQIEIQFLGPGAIVLVCLYAIAGVVLFILSFTPRHGRSRWPLHLLLATSLLSLGTGLFTAGRGAAIAWDALRMGGAEQNTEAALFKIVNLFSDLFWFGAAGLALAAFAFIRAAYGLIKEPGPRY